jgi:hypothetical protein
MIRTRDTWLEVAEEVWSLSAVERGAIQPAGGPAWAFLPTFIPMPFNGAGDDLIIDMRPGSLRGCIEDYLHQAGALFPPLYRGLGNLFTDVAAALRLGTPPMHHTPIVENQHLRWYPI